MFRSFHLLAGASLFAMLPFGAQAQSTQPQLVHPAEYGDIREVTGGQLLTATPRAGCPSKAQPIAGGPCFDKVMTAFTGHARILGLSHDARPGDRVAGVYGQDFTLYDVTQGPDGVQAQALPFQTSNVLVPRNCYALNGEGVGYVTAANGPYVSQESQLVVCDGGPHTPNGPYQPDGPSLASTPGGWHRTEMTLLEGQRRYLAEPGATCDPQYSLKTTYCAQPAVMFMQQNPGTSELDLIAARHAVRDGDILATSEIDQWVMKRKGNKGFKADSRWFDKSTLGTEDGCYAVQDVGWYVEQQDDGLYVTEKALNRCGAPAAPVPADTYEAFGNDYFVVDCSDHHDWRDRHDFGGHDDQSGDHQNGDHQNGDHQNGDHSRDDHHDADHHDNGGSQQDGDHHDDQDAGCFNAARDYLRKSRQTSATVVVLSEHARVDDHLYEGSYTSYDVAQVSLNNDGSLTSNRIDNYMPSDVSMSRCSPVQNGPAESHGFVMVRSMGISWARSYQWMSCPVY